MTPDALTSPLLDAVPGVRHAFFTRRGGVSRGIYESLNCGPGSRDDPDHVAENRRRAAAAFEVGPDRLLTAYQVHSAKALTVFGPWDETRPEGDAVVTGQAGLACGALSADCAPVLMVDAQARVAAAAHAGWKGAVAGIVDSAVVAMIALGAEPSRIVAAVGPCIGPDSYEVGPDFVETLDREAPGSDGFFRPAPAPGKRLFDLPGFVLERLARAGVTTAEWIGADTLADEDRFFSNRRATHRKDGDYGRLLSAIALV